MLRSTARVLGTLSIALASASAGEYPRDVVDELAVSGLSKLEGFLKQSPVSSCTLESAIRRKEWLVCPIQAMACFMYSISTGATYLYHNGRITSELCFASRQLQPHSPLKYVQDVAADLMTSTVFTFNGHQ
jgi:hypothetical protein